MHIYRNKTSIRHGLAEVRKTKTIAFVPTMGALHKGHHALIRHAETIADYVVVSIFINPQQFDRADDYARYPRTIDSDMAQLAESGIQCVFVPNEEVMYAHRPETVIDVPTLTHQLCAANRPGHFQGVALIVCKLLQIVRPDSIVLGQKDFQQLQIVRRLVADLDIPVSIRAVPTVRETDGLAVSSRNALLSPDARACAPEIYRTLCVLRDAIVGGDHNYAALQDTAAQRLTDAGFTVDYVAVCDSETLLAPNDSTQSCTVCIAAAVGGVRLIDNMPLPKFL